LIEGQKLKFYENEQSSHGLDVFVNKKVISLGDANIKLEEEVDDYATICVEVRYVMRVPKSELSEWKESLELASKGALNEIGGLKVEGHTGAKIDSSADVGAGTTLNPNVKSSASGSGSLKIGKN